MMFVIRILCIPHTESIVMFGNLDKIFHPRTLGGGDEFVSIEHTRIERLVKIVVDRTRHGRFKPVLSQKLCSCT